MTPSPQAIKAETASYRATYRGWIVYFNPPPIPSRNCDWAFYHEDYDGSEDAHDNRHGCAESLEAALAEIDEREDVTLFDTEAQ